MTALERARQNNPDQRPDLIIQFGCPNTYGVGKEPSWCGDRHRLGKTCEECWNQIINTSELICDWCQECETCKEIRQFCVKIISAGRKFFPQNYDIYVYEIYDIASKAMHIGFQLDISSRFIGKLEELKFHVIKDRDPEELLKEVVLKIKKARK